ncbi:MAG: glucose-6-phosphate isomerase [Lachnospiraceae bacterium]|nr:glucose-6-phosphate isomerase [Lachnospiraceae bacterium]
MNHVTFDASKALPFLSEQELAESLSEARAARAVLMGRQGEGNDFLGWLDLPVDYDKEEYGRIKAAAARIREDSDILVVVGIGGSYLGARAAVEFLGNPLGAAVGAKPQIFFAGNQISAAYLCALEKALEGKRFSINVISKSGTTTEPAIAFRLLKKILEERVGREEAAKRIYATTDKARGALKSLADKEGYECFVVPDDVGGRFSVLTAVGLLPIAVAGIDLDELMAGAQAMRTLCYENEESDALRYAAVRGALYRKGKTIEVLANYEPILHYIAEWWKQLYGESEGKGGKGIFPAAVDLTTDLHSMGQFIQDGNRILQETVIAIEKNPADVRIEAEAEDLDGLNYLAGRELDFVNKSAMQGTMLAHVDGGVPVSLITLPEVSAYSLGELFYFFEYAVGVSGYALKVNPFNQPGVESYKKNMFALLGKPGYEAAGEALRARL